ncbi:Uncharacterised protein [uncultured archaeon]|nr:Uncharacterised protein [uncultured archaeon]
MPDEDTIPVETEVKDAVPPVGVVEGEDGEIEQESRYFALSPLVRLMKEELDKDKIIRRRVKEGMLEFLEQTVRKVTKKMNESEYTVVEYEDYKTAVEPYELIDDVEKERERIVASLEKIKQDCDSLIRDVNRKFKT